MRNTLALFSLLLLSFGGGAAVAQQVQADDAQEVEAVAHDLWQAWIDQDADTILAICRRPSGVINAGATAQLRGLTDETAAAFRADIEAQTPPPVAVSVSGVEVTLIGRTGAVVLLRATAEGVFEDQPAAAAVFAKEDGEWKAVAMALTREPGGEPSEDALASADGVLSGLWTAVAARDAASALACLHIPALVVASDFEAGAGSANVSVLRPEVVAGAQDDIENGRGLPPNITVAGSATTLLCPGLAISTLQVHVPELGADITGMGALLVRTDASPDKWLVVSMVVPKR